MEIAGSVLIAKVGDRGFDELNPRQGMDLEKWERVLVAFQKSELDTEE